LLFIGDFSTKVFFDDKDNFARRDAAVVSVRLKPGKIGGKMILNSDL
jgi:hypothetical protein